MLWGAYAGLVPNQGLGVYKNDPMYGAQPSFYHQKAHGYDRSRGQQWDLRKKRGSRLERLHRDV